MPAVCLQGTTGAGGMGLPAGLSPAHPVSSLPSSLPDPLPAGASWNGFSNKAAELLMQGEGQAVLSLRSAMWRTFAFTLQGNPRRMAGL